MDYSLLASLGAVEVLLSPDTGQWLPATALTPEAKPKYRAATDAYLARRGLPATAGAKSPRNPASAGRGAGDAAVVASYPRSEETSGSSQVTGPISVAEWRFPDGTSDGHAIPTREALPANKQFKARPRGSAVLKSEEEQLAYRKRAARSAKRALQRFVRHHGLTRLLTFTNGAAGEGWTSRSQALNDVSDFVQQYRQLFPAALTLVAERGGRRGRWHVHGLTRPDVRLDYRRIIARYSRFLTRRGWVSVSAAGVHRFHAGEIGARARGARPFHSARIAAAYAVKYLGKAFAEEYEPNKHTYRNVGGETPKPLRSFAGSLGAALAGVGATSSYPLVHRLTGEIIGYCFDGHWTPPDRNAGGGDNDSSLDPPRPASSQTR